MELSADPPARAVTGKLMLYDGECPMCTRISAAFVRLGLFPEQERRAFQDCDGELAARLLEAGIRNEILILDSASGELRAGAAGILWMLRGTWIGGPARALERAPFLAAVTLLYRFAAYNRRFLAVPRPRGPRCACDPDDRPAYTWLLIAVCAGLAALTLTLLGLVAPPSARLVGSRLGLLGPSARAGGPWALALVAAAKLPAGTRLKYVGHLSVVAAAEALSFLPLALLGWLAPDAVEQAFLTLLQLSCVAAGLWTFLLWRRRVRFLALDPVFLWGGAACAALGLLALGWLRL